MLIPSKQKYRKVHRNRNSLKGKAYRGSSISFGDFRLKTIDKRQGLFVTKGFQVFVQYLIHVCLLSCEKFQLKQMTQV